MNTVKDALGHAARTSRPPRFEHDREKRDWPGASNLLSADARYPGGAGSGPMPSVNGAELGRLHMADEACDVADQPSQATTRPYTDLDRRIDLAVKEGSIAIERYNAAIRAREIVSRHPELAELLDLIRRF